MGVEEMDSKEYRLRRRRERREREARDHIRVGGCSEAYRKGWERIFGNDNTKQGRRV